MATKRKKKMPVDAMAWMEEFRKAYPAYSDWTTQQVIDEFGQDFVDVLMKAVDPEVEYSDEELQSLIRQTKYYNSTTAKQQQFDESRQAVRQQLLDDARRQIVSGYADLGLAEADLEALSRMVARNGLSGTALKQAVYQYASRNQGVEPSPQQQNLLQTADADSIRSAAKAYGYTPSDSELQAALTGGMYNGQAVSADSILQKAQRAAKGQFSQLADQIDAGLSLDDIFRNYRGYAADVLEVDPNSIDFMRDPKWSEAFGTKETGQLSLSDWVTKLKSDTRFGWQYTKQANQQATDVALSIARAFGKVQ